MAQKVLSNNAQTIERTGRLNVLPSAYVWCGSPFGGMAITVWEE